MSDERIPESVTRARAALEAGASLHDVLVTLPEDIEAVATLRAIEPLSLACAMEIVSEFRAGKRFAQLALRDLQLLGTAPPGRVDYAVARARERAIIDRTPFLLYVRKAPQETYAVFSHRPLATLPEPLLETNDAISGADADFDDVRERALRAATVWPAEIAIVRDETDELLVHFVNAPSLVH